MQKFLGWLVLGLIVPGMLLRINLNGAGILPIDILSPIVIALWLWVRQIKQKKIRPYLLWKSASVFSLIALISLILNGWDLDGKEFMLSLAHWIRWVALWLWGWLALDIWQEKKEKLQLQKGILIILSMVVSLGFLQFYLFPNLASFSTEGGWDPHTGRLLSTWLDPNFIGGLLVFFAPLLLGEIAKRKFSREKFIISILLLAVCLALFLTFSRSSYLAFACGMGLFLLYRYPKILLAVIAVAIIGVSANEKAQKRVVSFFDTATSILFQSSDEIDPTASLRIKSWQNSFQLWEKYPILGIGYNTYRFKAVEEGVVKEGYFSSGGADSTLLTILVTTGIFGLTAFLFFLGKIFQISWKAWRKNENIQHLAFCCGFLGLIIHSTFVNSLLYPFIFLLVISWWASIQSAENKS